jgi:hypothetical protein
MSRAAFTIKAFGLYLLVLGVSLILVPNLLLSVFGLPETNEVWIRVVGALAFNIGIYYIYAAKCEARAFFQASVYTRAFVLAAFAAFAVLGFVSPILILFGFIDFSGGIWTHMMLREKMTPA